jgi:hypothetical protein
VSAALERLCSAGIRVAEIADALGVRGIDVARWRRGQPVALYRRDDIERRLAGLTIAVDPVTGSKTVASPKKDQD